MSKVFTHLNFEYFIAHLSQSVLSNATSLVRRGAVIGMAEDERRITAKVQEYGWAHQVEILMDEDGYNADLMCDCGYQTSTLPCVHMLAVLLSASAFDQGEEDILSSIFGQETPATKANPVLWIEANPKAIEADYRKNFDRMTVRQLRDLAARRGIVLKGLKREIIFETMIQNVVRPENLEETLGRLHAESRRVLDLARLLGVETFRYGVSLNQVLPYLQAALEPFKPQRTAASCMDDLTQLGLLIANDDGSLQAPLQVLAHHSVNPDLFVEYQGTVDAVDESVPNQFSRLAMLLALSGQSGDLPLNPVIKSRDYSGWPKTSGDPYSNATVVQLEGNLVKDASLVEVARSVMEPMVKVDFCARSLLAGGFWVERDPRRLSNAFMEWLQQPPALQSRSILRHAILQRSTFELEEACSAGNFSLNRHPSNMDYDSFILGLVGDRLRLLRLLSSAPVGAWLDIDAILRLLHGLTPYWLPEFNSRISSEGRGQGRLVLPTSIERQGKRLDILDYDSWSKTMGLFYVKAITQAFFWLGLLDVAWYNKRPVACRLTPFGEYLIERSAEFTAGENVQKLPAIQVDLDLSIRLNLESAGAELINFLLISGRQRGGKSAPHGNKPAFVYEITLQGLGRAFEAGWDVERVRSILERSSMRLLPENFAAFIQNAWDNYGRLHLYTDIALLEFADDYCLPELLANSSLNQILLYTFSPRVVAVRPDGVESLVKELRSRGYTPQVEGEQHG